MRKKLATLVALFVCVAAGAFFAVGARGIGSARPPLIVVDRSIGGIAIGMSQGAVEDLYGPPDDSMETVGGGLLVHYHVHGGELIVIYAGGRVVSVSTDSSFYRTKGGAGPGAPVPGDLPGFGEDFCSLGLWDGADATSPGAVVTAFERNGGELGAVTITVLGYYDLCESVPADQEVPDPRPASFRLDVRADPDGGGWIQSTPYLIDCPDACTRPVDRDTTVKLEAHPTGGYTFEGWSGACSGTGACTVTMSEPRSVVAHFSGFYVPPPPPQKLPKTGTTG